MLQVCKTAVVIVDDDYQRVVRYDLISLRLLRRQAREFPSRRNRA